MSYFVERALIECQNIRALFSFHSFCTISTLNHDYSEENDELS